MVRRPALLVLYIGLGTLESGFCNLNPLFPGRMRQINRKQSFWSALNCLYCHCPIQGLELGLISSTRSCEIGALSEFGPTSLRICWFGPTSVWFFFPPRPSLTSVRPQVWGRSRDHVACQGLDMVVVGKTNIYIYICIFACCGLVGTT